MAKPSRLGRKHDVAGADHLAAASQAPAVHLGHDWLAVAPHPQPAVDGHAQIFAVQRDPRLTQLPGLIAAALVRQPTHCARARRQIIAGAERTAGALEPYHADVVPRIQLTQSRLKIIPQRAGDCIQLLGTVQRDRRDRTVCFDENVFVVSH